MTQFTLQKLGNCIQSSIPFTPEVSIQEYRLIFILMKTRQPVHTIVSVVVTNDGDIIPNFIFQHGLRFNIEAYVKCLEGVVLAWINRGLLEDTTSANRTLCECFSATTSLLLSGCLTPRLQTSYYRWGAVEQNTKKTCPTINNGSIYQLKQGDHWEGL